MIILKVRRGKEKSVQDSLIKSNFKSYLPEIFESKNKSKLLYPSRIFVEISILENPDLMRELEVETIKFNATDPYVLTAEEKERIVSFNDEVLESFKVGQKVRIVSGLFKNYNGTVEEILQDNILKIIVDLSLDSKISTMIESFALIASDEG